MRSVTVVEEINRGDAGFGLCRRLILYPTGVPLADKQWRCSGDPAGPRSPRRTESYFSNTTASGEAPSLARISCMASTMGCGPHT